MEKTMSKKRNIFTYTADFFRSIGTSVKAFLEVEENEEKEGLEAFRSETMSKEDAKQLETLIESQKNLSTIEMDHAKLIASIDYPQKGKEFKSEVKAEELDKEEIVSPEQERDEEKER